MRPPLSFPEMSALSATSELLQNKEFLICNINNALLPLINLHGSYHYVRNAPDEKSYLEEVIY